ncbi:hypothetical protein K443DRAFT_612774 [Laccaria amethystina LaAM-08-1]|uniref:Uncharacterized protein n=1 Tax=Laccaria amethystina LaAM-08-1 TaxID=1095629 RepID=A0A0C9XFE1_9AGAR|nr:hypothetical protein K443DRAFT_612774 [Laccaria amethystina LaAM-08-1]
MKVSVVFVFPPRNTFSTLRTSPFSCSVRPFIYPLIPLRQLRPRTLEHPPWWSSIVPPATVLPHHTSSGNLCTLLSPSIAFPQPIDRHPHPFRTLCRIRLDQPLPLPSFPLSMAPIRPSSARSLKRC